MTSTVRILVLCLVVVTAASVRAQRNPPVKRADLPIGIGIASVLPTPGTILRLYRRDAR